MQGYISSVAVVPPVRMDLSGSEVQMVESYRLSLEHWGWRWKSCGSDASSLVLTHFGCVLDASMNAVDLQVGVYHSCFWCVASACSRSPVIGYYSLDLLATSSFAQPDSCALLMPVGSM